MIAITLNGKHREIEAAANVTSLLRDLGVNPKQVAVAINGEVVPRAAWDETAVKEGDIVEVVRAVGGGATALTPVPSPAARERGGPPKAGRGEGR